MYYIEKTLTISASHFLELNYESKCSQLHGHNWIITIYCKSERLNLNGMVIDFSDIKKVVSEKLDHQNLNSVLIFSPTAENIAKWTVDNISNCYKCKVQEAEGSIAIYEI